MARGYVHKMINEYRGFKHWLFSYLTILANGPIFLIDIVTLGFFNTYSSYETVLGWSNYVENKYGYGYEEE